MDEKISAAHEHTFRESKELGSIDC
jgi:hypothetical protein